MWFVLTKLRIGRFHENFTIFSLIIRNQSTDSLVTRGFITEKLQIIRD